jgi:hypothetical protein
MTGTILTVSTTIAAPGSDIPAGIPTGNCDCGYREKGKWVGRYVHEKVELKKGSSTKLLKGHIEHYSFYSVSDHIRQVNNFTTLAASSYYDEGINSGYMKIIFPSALEVLQRADTEKGFYAGLLRIGDQQHYFLSNIS